MVLRAPLWEHLPKQPGPHAPIGLLTMRATPGAARYGVSGIPSASCGADQPYRSTRCFDQPACARGQ
jgi:hypothetical protein